MKSTSPLQALVVGILITLPVLTIGYILQHNQKQEYMALHTRIEALEDELNNLTTSEASLLEELPAHILSDHESDC